MSKGKHSIGDKIAVNQVQVVMPFGWYVSADFDTRYKEVHTFGHNDSLGTTYEDIRVNGDQPVYLEEGNPQPMEVVSTSANDADGGTGAREVRVRMIDTDGMQYEFDVTLNGTTPVPLTTTDEDGNTISDWIFCNRVFVRKTGSLDENDGDITVRTTSGATPASTEIKFMEAGSGIDHDIVYFIPNNYSSFLLTKLDYSTPKNEQVDIELRYKYDGDAWLVEYFSSIFQEHSDREFTPPLRIPAGSYVVLRAKAATSGGEVSAEINGITIY